ncbi:MAG TPA: HNH endonuclease signature motif containing protein [Anaerolineae bacterium]
MSKKVRQHLESVTNKRARIVIQHILKNGFITTEDLEKKYGYNHPPRAARDVREAGIPLETFRVRSSDGRSIAAYKFGDLSQIRVQRLQGRRNFPKKLKDELHQISDGKCATCAGKFELRYLQIDHRVPYEVAGDKNSAEWSIRDFMLLCGSCNRAKSWSCEHCANWLSDQLPQVCLTCYWANPDDYSHIALREVRRADILWNEDEVQAYERLKKAAQTDRFPVPEYVKKIIEKCLDEK